MSGVPGWVIFATTKVQPTFSSVSNAPKTRTGTATGFFIDCGGWSALVTNKHVVNGSIWPDPADWKLTRLQIQVRQGPQANLQPAVEMVDVDLEHSRYVYSEDADVVAIGVRLVPGEHSHLEFVDINLENVADEAFLRERAELMDLASFVGFPSTKNTPWWDERWNTPIARMASLASPPGRPFYNEKIKTADVGLVSGLSFTGSSGSPLFLHEKGIKNMSAGNAGYQAPKLIGIMSGHLPELDKDRGSETFPHSGLSHYTRATAIRDVLDKLAARREYGGCG